MKWLKQPAALLLTLLVASSLVMTAAGLGIRSTVGPYCVQARETMAVALPFLYLRGDLVLITPPPEEEDPAADPAWQDPPKPNNTETLLPVSPSLKVQAPHRGKPAPRQGHSIITTAGGYYFGPAEEAHFQSTLFIGDSRTVGMALYSRLGEADYFADVGMSVYNLFKTKVSDTYGSLYLNGLLTTRTYDTIYLMLGINELGYPLEDLKRQYGVVIDQIMALQPQAHIILEANIGITQKKEASSKHLSMERIRALNDSIASFADGEKVFYLDANAYFADATGYLRADATGDGVHPYAAGYKDWTVWLREHALLKAED